MTDTRPRKPLRYLSAAALVLILGLWAWLSSRPIPDHSKRPGCNGETFYGSGPGDVRRTPEEAKAATANC